VPAVLGPEDFHSAGDRDVPDPLEAAFLPPCRDDTATRAAGWLVRLNNDPATAVSKDTCGNDTVVGQVKDAGGSVRRRPGRGNFRPQQWSTKQGERQKAVSPCSQALLNHSLKPLQAEIVVTATPVVETRHSW
jgi:hypothetical protein